MLSAQPVSVLHENSDYSRITASKTPGRALKGRAGLQENVLQNGSMTTNSKEKRAALQTPFCQGTSKIILQDARALSKVATFTNTRPLGDKTPKPNRQSLSIFTPGPHNTKQEKYTLPVLQDEADVKSPTPPPSSSRRKLRSPRISKTFHTPLTTGDHWNVSDVSIEEEISIMEQNDEAASGTDDSEPEYMPPKPVESPYEPTSNLPDYKEIGQTLCNLAYSYPADDSPHVYLFDSEDLLKGCEWSRKHMHLSIPESDDDRIFGKRKQDSKANNRMASSARTLTTRPAFRLTRVPSTIRDIKLGLLPPRPATSTAVRPPDAGLGSIYSRPGTSTSKLLPTLSRAPSKSTVRATLPARATSTKHDSEDMLASQFVDELEPFDDFRFTI